MLNKHADVTELIIQAFFTVYNTLGYGFSEKVYKGAMIIELARLRLKVMAEYPIKVYYRDAVAAEFFIDLLVNDCVIVEINPCASVCIRVQIKEQMKRNGTLWI